MPKVTVLATKMWLCTVHTYLIFQLWRVFRLISFRLAQGAWPSKRLRQHTGSKLPCPGTYTLQSSYAGVVSGRGGYRSNKRSYSK